MSAILHYMVKTNKTDQVFTQKVVVFTFGNVFIALQMVHIKFLIEQVFYTGCEK